MTETSFVMKRLFLLISFILWFPLAWSQPHIPFKMIDALETQEEIDYTLFTTEMYVGEFDERLWRKCLNTWSIHVEDDNSDIYSSVWRPLWLPRRNASVVYNESRVYMRTISQVVNDTLYDIDIDFDLRFCYNDGIASISLGRIYYMAATEKDLDYFEYIYNTERSYSRLGKKGRIMTDWVIGTASEQFDLLVDSFKKEFCQGNDLF